MVEVPHTNRNHHQNHRFWNDGGLGTTNTTTNTCRDEAASTTSNLAFISKDALADRLQQNFNNVTAADTEVLPESPTSRSKRLLLIDLRSLFQFQESHVRESINLTNCPLVCKRIQDGKLQIKDYLEARLLFDGSQDVVIYEQGQQQLSDCDQQNSSNSSTSSLALDCALCEEKDEEGRRVTSFAKLIFKNLKKVTDPSVKIEILRGGFDSFRQHYPDHCTQGVPLLARVFVSNVVDQNDESTYLNWTATQIRDNIFVGALHDATNDELMEELKITHILNCSRTPSRKALCNKYKYLELKCEDNLKQRLNCKLESAFAFIDEAVREEGRVLIHCYAGVSRSAAITVAYMMHKFELTYNDAYKELKQKRSIVAPNINFVSQLMKFDEQKRSERLAITCGEELKTVKDEQPVTEIEKPALSDDTCSKSQELKKLQQQQQTTTTGGGGGGLAAKRKLMQLKMPMKPLNLGTGCGPSNATRFENIASAPILPPSYNPFGMAFKKANCSRHSPPDSFGSSLLSSSNTVQEMSE